MKQFILSKAAARVIYIQLEGKGEGYTIKQIRLLDKIMIPFETVLTGYNSKIDTRIEQAKEELRQNPDDQEIINESMNNDLDSITENEGKELITINLEDEQFIFIKEIWDAISGFRGGKDVRRLVLEVDDSLNHATEQQQEDNTKVTG